MAKPAAPPWKDEAIPIAPQDAELTEQERRFRVNQAVAAMSDAGSKQFVAAVMTEKGLQIVTHCDLSF